MEIKIRTENREEQNYAAIRKTIRMEEIPSILPPLIPEVLNWLKERNIEPVSAPFFNFVNMRGGIMDVEVGFVTGNKTECDETVSTGKFEAGKYIIATYYGPYQNLPKVHQQLGEYAKENGLKTTTATEFYVTDPQVETDEKKWQTDIVAMLGHK